jgi:hypothetical protein
MSTGLLERESVRANVPNEPAKVMVPVTLLLLEDGKITFEPAAEKNLYSVIDKTITLYGSGGSPRQYMLTFTLSSPMIEQGYTFYNPALKFFQGDGKTAGFRFPPESSKTEALVSVFNTKTDKDLPARDTFNILLFKDGIIIEDPTIFWDPPGGGV